MPQPPTIAVAIEGGLIQGTLIEGWPAHQPLPHLVVVDYDTEGVGDDELTAFSIGDEIVEAVCRVERPSVYEAFDTPALSPRAVLAALGAPIDAEPSALPIAAARALRRHIQDLEDLINLHERPPDGGDYTRLYVLAVGGLTDILMALGNSGPDKP